MRCCTMSQYSAPSCVLCIHAELGADTRLSTWAILRLAATSLKLLLLDPARISCQTSYLPAQGRSHYMLSSPLKSVFTGHYEGRQAPVDHVLGGVYWRGQGWPGQGR